MQDNMMRWDDVKFIGKLIRISEEKIKLMNENASNYIMRREYQINRWKDRILEIERESLYRKTDIGFKFNGKNKKK